MSPFQGGANRIAVDEAHRRTQDADAPAVLLDVRERGERDAGHAPGAVFAPLSGLAAGAAPPDAARSRPLVAICRSGNRSQRAAGLLVARGKEAAGVRGGTEERAAAGHPVVDSNGNDGSPA